MASLLLALSAVLAAGCASSRPLFPVQAPAHYLPVPVSGAPVVGVDLYAASGFSPRRLLRDATRNLAYIRRTLHAQEVGIAWNLSEPNRYSSVVRQTRQSLTPADVATLTRLATKDGLRVEYRPLISTPGGGVWGGFFQPADPSRWFASFYQAELPYLRVAQRYHIREFVTSTELVALAHSPGWAGFFRSVRKIYRGIVSYASFATDFWNPESRYLLPVRDFGVTSYPDIDLPPTATVAQLERQWEQVFSPMPTSIVHRTAIDEVGIPAARNAYKRPWAWQSNLGPLDEQVQARWFTAACGAARHYGLRALFFWNLNLADNPARPPAHDLPAFAGRLGAAAIARCAHPAASRSAQ